VTIDPITLPWTWEYAAGGEAWAIVRTRAGDFIARVQAPLVQAFVQLPDLLQGRELVEVPPTPTTGKCNPA
jgi:hypothetical protein